MTADIAGISVPDSRIAREAAELIRDETTDLLFTHSLRVYYFASLRGQAREMSWDAELLYVAALFHDLGLVHAYSSTAERFEIDGANAAREFLTEYEVSSESVLAVWDAIALHTTFGIPRYKRPEVSLLQAGVDVDVLGRGLDEIAPESLDEVLGAYPRMDFKEGIIKAFAQGIAHKPETAFGNIKADVLMDQLPEYRRSNFVDCIRASQLEG
jgi:predicted hydrolase (HD superfamily)